MKPVFYNSNGYVVKTREIKRFIRVLSAFAAVFIIIAVPAGESKANGGKADETVIVAMGDSLSAGYRLEPDASFPAQLQSHLQKNGHAVRVINAGVSGDTSSSGRARLDWVLSDIPNGRPGLLILELGSNDALRGVEPAIVRNNLDYILEKLAERDIPVLLVGMIAPPNLGQEYSAEFNTIFPDLAEKYQTVLYPFFLEGVAADPALNLDDGIHPNREGIGIIVEKIAPFVLTALEK